MDQASRKEYTYKESDRFELGANWRSFLNRLDKSQVEITKLSLKERLQLDALKGSTFLDGANGNRLSSSAARNMGTTVVLFDFDLQNLMSLCDLALY
jgi:hypothetical protein